MTSETPYLMHIGAGWQAASNGQTRVVTNPATGEHFAEAPEATAEDAHAALEAAQAAQPAWARLTSVQRAGYLSAIANAVRAHAREMALLLVREQGKTLVEAEGEIEGTAGYFDFFATFARTGNGEIVPSDNPDEQIWIRKVPYGVVAALTPWNYPAGVFARKVAPAIFAGNTVVLKPHENTPLTSLLLARAIDEAGVPPGVVNVITGAGPVVGEALVSDSLTQLVTLTGSVRAGRQVLQAAAKHITPVFLELGGKAPFVVLDDSDIDKAVQAAVAARFVNCGQVCTCNERTYVQRGIYDQFLDRYVAAVSRLRLGDPLQPTTDVGPKISLAELEKVERMVSQAQAEGAQVAIGGHRPEGPAFQGGFWYTPTVLVNVRNDMAIMQDEIFGPVSPVMPFDDFEEALTLANDTTYGLSAYIFTNDFRRLMRVVDSLDFGELYVNTSGPEQFQGYHTGYRLSGQGGDDGAHGLDHYYRRRTVYVNYAA